jgi:hypothetical protein
MCVAFFDATNTTRDRRQKIMDRARKEKNVQLLFVESICDDPKILERNYQTKMENGDYKNQVCVGRVGASFFAMFCLNRYHPFLIDVRLTTTPAI